jgi:hypothetical protein
MTVEEAYEKKISDVPLTIEGKVIEVLEDDPDLTPHQRFIVQIPASPTASQGGHKGHTVLISHNLDRAYRVPVKLGDEVEVHGTYKWNGLGGIIHKTHHDDRDKHEDGWINYAGKKHQ